MAYALAHRTVSTARRTGLVSFMTAGLAAWRQRRALARLDAHARRDLGLSGREVFVEINPPDLARTGNLAALNRKNLQKHSGFASVILEITPRLADIQAKAGRVAFRHMSKVPFIGGFHGRV